MTLSPAIREADLTTLVERFYARVRRDPEIGPVFHAAIGDWDVHLVKLAAFWSSVMLASGCYKGNPMASHLKLRITPAMFDRWLMLWDRTVDELFEPVTAQELRTKARRIAESLRLALFCRPDATSHSGLEPAPASVRKVMVGQRR